MAIPSSEEVRITIPVPADMSRELAILAFAADLTKGQMVRRWLTACIADAKRRHADLAGLSVDDWWSRITHDHQVSRENYERLALVEQQGTRAQDVRD